MASTMMKPLILLAAISAAGAATSVAVLEFGAKKGSVRRTVSSNNVDTTAAAVTSFFNALHRNRRSLQQSGMPLVPDLFTRADLGIVLSIRGDGVDLDRMPVLSGLLDEDSANSNKNSAVVGHMDMEGSKCHALMNKVDDVKKASSPSEMISAVKTQTEGKGLVGVDTEVAAANVKDVDKSVGDLVQNLQEWAVAAGKTIVVHLVVEEEGGPSRRRSRSLAAAAAAAASSSTTAEQQKQSSSSSGRRRLEDEKAGEQQNGNGNGNGYYGYGYYNAYGEWVTPYKTMFQIQYFNVVLWTALGLVAALTFVVYLMLYMPLEPDTLLFGESAKLVGSE